LGELAPVFSLLQYKCSIAILQLTSI